MITNDEVRDRMVAIARQLLKRTLREEISWDETDREEDFLYSGTDSSVSIYRNPRLSAHNGQYTLKVFNPRGAAVGELVSGSLTRDDPQGRARIAEPAPWNNTLAELHTAARTSALNVEGILDGLINQLSEDDNGDSSK